MGSLRSNISVLESGCVPLWINILINVSFWWYSNHVNDQIHRIRESLIILRHILGWVSHTLLRLPWINIQRTLQNYSYPWTDAFTIVNEIFWANNLPCVSNGYSISWYVDDDIHIWMNVRIIYIYTGKIEWVSNT